MSDPIDPGMVMDSIPPETKFDENPPPVVKLPVSAGNTPAPISEPATIPAENPVVAPPAGKTIVPPPPPEPPKRGRHPLGCKCGRCIQSGGSGGYDKSPGKLKGKAIPGYKPPTIEEPADFSDVLGEDPSPGPQNPNPIPGLAQAAQSAGTDYGALASMFFATGVGIGTAIFGPEWQAKSPEEKQMVCGPLAVYLKSKGMTDLPPGVVLSIVVLAYSAPRLQAPATRQKIQAWWFWVKSKFFRRKG